MTLVVDASALVAIALGEPDAPALEVCLTDAPQAFATAMNLTEAGLALVLRRGHFTPAQFQEWLAALGVVEAHVGGGEALDAYLRYGKGVHRAGLNLGDCFAYALAKRLDAPLLYKGSDFTLTDVRPALQPT